MHHRSVIKKLFPFLSLLLFTLAIFVLHHELARYHFNEIINAFHQLADQKILMAMLLTLISYLIMSGYDFLGLYFIRHPLGYAKIILASFVGYAFSNNIGLSMIAGASVRYRLYSAWGLSGIEITKIVFFCTVTLWMGFFMLGGIVFTFNPLGLPPGLYLPLNTVKPIGILMLLSVILYFFITTYPKSPFKFKRFGFLHASPRIFLLQLCIATADWLIAAAVFYVLLPNTPAMTFSFCLSAYLMAQLIGLVSQVPGGLGVFETVLLLELSPIVPAAELMGSLLAFRFIYYLLPFAAAISLLGFQELIIRRKWAQKITFLFEHWVAAILPLVLSFAVFFSGTVLLISGVTPTIDNRLAWLKGNIPLTFLEISHFVGSLAGVGLLILARGLQRRMGIAYTVTIVLLIVGIIASLVKGLDYEEALILTLVLITLFAGRNEFYRKTSFWSQRFSTSWISTIAMIIISSVGLGFFVYKHVEYSNLIWWKFAFSGDAPRFLRATVGVVGLILIIGCIRLLRSAPPKIPLPNAPDIHTATPIVRQSKDAVSNLALLGDKSFLFNPEQNAFIMFGVEKRSWVSMGNPVGPESQWSELIWQFRELSDRYGGWTVFYEIPANAIHYYMELGLTVTKLGEEARIHLPEFSLEGSNRKELRYIHRKIQKEAYAFEIVPMERVSYILPELKTISDTWMTEKNTREKGFSLGYFSAEYLARFPVAVVRKNQEIIAFATLWQSAELEEISIDLMRYDPKNAPNGIMDYMFVELLLWSGRQGYQWFNLGMAPLTGLEDHFLAPLWNRLASFVATHGEHFYNFQGLRQYKDKFGPVWLPKYLISPGGIALPQILINLLSLISGSLKGAVSK